MSVPLVKLTVFEKIEKESKKNFLFYHISISKTL